MSHEIGHDLALTHTDDLNNTLKARFDSTNVMWASSSSRSFLTEDQTFRAHMTATSFFNTSPGKPRRGEPIRDCAADKSSKTCLSIKKRLWADGCSGDGYTYGHGHVPTLAHAMAVGVVIALALAGASTATGQPRPPAAALETVLTEWLLKDCGLSDASR